MSNSRKVIALIGSTRGKKTTSESIINYLNERVNPQGIEIKKYRAYQLYQSPEMKEQFIDDIKESRLLLICAPLYVDSLPHPVLSIFEELHTLKRGIHWEDKQLLAIVHSGYPEPVQRQTCLDICRCFASEMGMEWLGGLGFGGTSIINGEPLEEMGRFSRHLCKALEEISASVSTGEKIPEQAVEISNKNPIPLPVRALKILLNWMIKRQAKKEVIDLYARPYQ